AVTKTYQQPERSSISNCSKRRQVHNIQPSMKYLCLAVLLVLPIFLMAQEDILLKADLLFAQRDQQEKLIESIQLIENFIGHDGSKDYEAFWRLSKYRYYLGDMQSNKQERTRIFKAGMEAANQAIQLNGKKAEGHFWLANNTGSYAEMQGVWKSLRM